MARTIAERLQDDNNFFNRFGDNLGNNLRVAIPGIIQSFDTETQTVTVQPAIMENIRNNDLSISSMQLPLLLDVPIILPKAGDFILTMPVKQGDECLVIFADMCIDMWWQAGGIQKQAEKRRHDLSDAFVILGTWSQPNRISNYSTDSAQLRTKSGETYIEIKEGQINLVATTITKNGSPL